MESNAELELLLHADLLPFVCFGEGFLLGRAVSLLPVEVTVMQGSERAMTVLASSISSLGHERLWSVAMASCDPDEPVAFLVIE